MADLDVVVVGAGFAGIYAVHALRSAGLAVRAFEAGSGIGGTWFWNRYPGARCDIESVDYSYSFDPALEQDWTWSERYPAQPEVLRYLNHVADRYGLRPDIQLNTRVTACVWDDARREWTVLTGDGESRTARFCVMAAGCLSERHVPELPGLETFRGDWYHTSRWPADGVDFTGRRVGLVGTGSSGIQVAPEIAAQAEHLTVFQRTAHFAVPNRNRRLSAEEADAIKARGVAAVEATDRAQDDWVEHVNDVAYATLFPQAESWYVGANIPGKPRVFMPYVGGVGPYREQCDAVAASGYDGFTLTYGG